jgi:DNA replication regulator SLD2
MPTSIGPTPQKNGRVLGLFDLLEENTENEPPNGYNAAAGGKGSKTQATPSKAPAAKLELGRSPMTPSRRNMLNAFTTPKGRKEGSNNPLGARTPSSVSKLHLSTPAFLRRAPLLLTVDEEGHYAKSPEPIIRLPRKPLGRSLSSVVASLRKLEEEKLDEELEALHEMENEMNATSSNTAKPPATAATTAVPQKSKNVAAVGPEILEPDSQGPQLLGGFDDEALYDSPTEEAAKGRDGQPLRVYKKKGQKRTTRRVNMRPTRAKRPENMAAAEEDDASGVENEDDEVVLETQFDPNKPIEELPEVDDDSGFEFGDDGDYVADDGEEDDDKTPAKKKSKKSAAGTDKKDKKNDKKKEGKEGKVKKAARKVNELAHANFKRLKLRNTGSKGGPSFGSRFRRRR